MASGLGHQEIDRTRGDDHRFPRVVIFGAFYPARGVRPPGLHDIHLNQGDALGSSWWPLDGIWQDGLTIAVHSDGTASAFMNKFSTQAMSTDDQGHPA
jgi:uncharacterized protein YukJ